MALAAENEDDANTMMDQFRERMKLRPNVITVKEVTMTEMKKYLPNEGHLEYFNKNKRELDFKGYLSEMFTCPTSIKAYLCQQYGLHRIPIFGAKAESQIEKLVNELEISLFFVGEVRNYTSTSRYGNKQKSTSSSRVSSKNLMHISLDKEQIRQVDSEFKKVQDEHTKAHTQMRNDIENQKNSERLVEAKKKDLKEMQQKLQYKKILTGKLIAKIEQMKNLETQANIVDVDQEQRRICKEKHNLISQCVRLNGDLKKLLGMLMFEPCPSKCTVINTF